MFEQCGAIWTTKIHITRKYFIPWLWLWLWWTCKKQTTCISLFYISNITTFLEQYFIDYNHYLICFDIYEQVSTCILHLSNAMRWVHFRFLLKYVKSKRVWCKNCCDVFLIFGLNPLTCVRASLFECVFTVWIRTLFIHTHSYTLQSKQSELVNETLALSIHNEHLTQNKSRLEILKVIWYEMKSYLGLCPKARLYKYEIIM